MWWSCLIMLHLAFERECSCSVLLSLFSCDVTIGWIIRYGWGSVFSSFYPYLLLVLDKSWFCWLSLRVQSPHIGLNVCSKLTLSDTVTCSCADFVLDGRLMYWLSAKWETLFPCFLALSECCMSVGLFISIISSRQAETDGYQQHGFELLTTLIQCNVVCPGRQVWSLFLSDVAHPTPSSLAFLSHLLATCRIPENYQPNILGSGFAAEKGTFPLRKHLLSWVTLGLTSLTSSIKESVKMSSADVAWLLVQLVLRNPGQLSKACEPMKDFMTSLEKVYLLTTFNCELDFEAPGREALVKANSEACHVIPVLVTCLGETLQNVMQQHLELAEPQVRLR